MQKSIKVIKILPGLFGSDCMSISFSNLKNIVSSSLCFLGLSELILIYSIVLPFTNFLGTILDNV